MWIFESLPSLGQSIFMLGVPHVIPSLEKSRAYKTPSSKSEKVPPF